MSRCLALVLVVLLAACAQPAETGRMTVDAGAPFPAPFPNSMCVRNVTGGEETNPLWVSKVDDAAFKTALTESMKRNGLLSGATPCPYPTDVNLLGLSQPVAGFALTVTSHVNYKVHDSANKPILAETITAPYTAEFSEHAIAIIRLQRANEGSVRASISAFFDKLRAWTPGKAVQ